MKLQSKNMKLLSKKFTIFILLLIIIFDLSLSIIIRDSTKSYIENLYFSSQIIASIFVAGGVIVALWQYYQSVKSERKNLEFLQVQRAVDMSQYYKDNILHNIPAIKYIFKSSGISDILKKYNTAEIKEFTEKELNSIFSENDIKKLKEIQESDKFFSAVIEANLIYNLKLHDIPNDSPRVENYIYTAFAANLISETANNLEYFALHFRHNTADQSVIYQSLHKSYFEIVRMLYYFIAKNNTDLSDKLYTNVSWLYNEWFTQKISNDKEHQEYAKKIISTGTVIEN